jgi:hypothetical protein
LVLGEGNCHPFVVEACTNVPVEPKTACGEKHPHLEQQGRLCFFQPETLNLEPETFSPKTSADF